MSLLPHTLICFFFFFFFMFSASSSASPSLKVSTEEFRNYTAISDFRVINRRSLSQCLHLNPYLQITTTNKTSGLSNEEYVTVTVSGVFVPDRSDWVGMISRAHPDVVNCPLVSLLYKETGDLSSLPLLCHYPVKAQYLSNDPNYLGCKMNNCLVNNRKTKGVCDVKTCSASLTFHVVNIRTEIEFVLFTSGFEQPCWLKSSGALRFSNPNAPLYGHLSCTDSTGTSMKLTWVSGDKKPQQVQYGGANSQTSQVATFTQDEMCSNLVTSPAKDFGWHDPGYIHSAVMTGLHPSSNYSYKYGSDSVGWSDEIQFRTPPAGGSDQTKFLIVGDMGKTPRDKSQEHYIQPGALAVITAMAEDIASGKVDSVFHIGDISYATGFLVEWDYFLHLITPVASHVPYMTAIGNHERDFPDTGSFYNTPDSGGECGIPYETYFPMPTSAKDKPWYSLEQGSVHFTVMSTEHNWAVGSEQYNWIKQDLGSVDRTKTPWVIFTGHRPMYSTLGGILPGVDPVFPYTVESLLLDNKVDLAFWGHVHNYERTCAVYQSNCKALPTKDQNGIDTYNSITYTAPVHAIVGMGGFELDQFSRNVASWSLVRIAQYGYARVHATKADMQIEFVNANTRKVEDSFHFVKGQRSQVA